MSLNANDKLLEELVVNDKCARRRHKHYALAVVRRSAGRPKFNQLEMVTTFTYRPSLVKIDARNFELSW